MYDSLEYRTSVFEREHEESVAHFYSLLSGQSTKKNLAYFKWKYDENPWIDRRLMVLCYYGTQLVGMRGATGTRWETRSGNGIVLPCAHDLLIHPDHRSKGIFIPLMKHLEKVAEKAGHHALINLSGGKDTQALQLGTGWQEVQVLKELSSYASISGNKIGSNVHKSVVGRYARRIARRFNALPPMTALQNYSLSRALENIGRVNNRIHMSDQVNFSDISALSGLHPKPFIEPAKDEKSFSWRVKNPNWKFRVAYWIDGSPQGYFLLTWKKKWPGSIFVFDFAVSNLDVFSEMVIALTTTLRIPLRILENSLTSDQAAALKNFGFSTAIEGFPEGIKKRFMLKYLKGTDDQTRTILDELKHSNVHSAEKK